MKALIDFSRAVRLGEWGWSYWPREGKFCWWMDVPYARPPWSKQRIVKRYFGIGPLQFWYVWDEEIET